MRVDFILPAKQCLISPSLRLAGEFARCSTSSPVSGLSTAHGSVHQSRSGLSRDLAAELAKEISSRLSSQSFQGFVREGNLAAAELQINDALLQYQQDARAQQGPDLKDALQPGLRGSKHALYKHVQGYFNLCIKQKKLVSALQCARLLPPDPELFTALLKACLDHGDLQAVADAVQVRKEAGIPEDAFCYTALLKAAAREQNAERTEDLFRRAWKCGIQGAPIFNALISQHNAAGKTKEAFAVFDRMLKLGVEPDVYTINSLIKAASLAGRMDTVKQLYRQMMNLGPMPNPVTYVHIFSACQNSQEKDYSWLRKVFGDMASLGISPVTQHFVTYLGACCEMPLSGREIQQVFAQAMAYCTAQKGDCSVYAALLKFSVRQGIPEKALDVWKAMQKGKHEMNSWVYAALFTACAAYKSPEHSLLLTQAHASMQRHYRDAKKRRGLTADEQRGMRIAFNALLNAYAKTGMLRSAEELLESMKTSGPAPDIISYNTLISGYAQAADTNGAFDCFYKLCEASSEATAFAFCLRPNSRTFGAMLHSCARAGNADSAKKVLELMQHAGLTPTAEAYTSVMHACIKQGSPDNIAYAFEVFETMKSEGITPSAVTYGCLMNGCELRGEIDQAVALYQEACTKDVFPSDECHNTLVNMFAKRDRLGEVLEVIQLQARRRKGLGFRAGILNSLARALASEHVEQGTAIVADLRKKGLKVQRDTYVALIQACTQESLIDTAHKLYWALSDEGAVASQEAGSRLIMALCRANQPREALAVYEDMLLNTHAPAQGSLAQTATAISGLSKASEASKLGEMSERADHVSSKGAQHALKNETGSASAAQHIQPSAVEIEGPTLTEQLGLRYFKFFMEEDAAPSTSEKAKGRQMLRQKSKRPKHAVFPHSRAIAALVQSFAQLDLDRAFELYCQLQQDSAGAAAVTLSNRFMWQSLIEAACRNSRLDIALQVYDDWKDYCAMQEALHRFEDNKYASTPRLSNVTLAFLEACCRAEANRATGEEAERFSLRMYDVCATLRQQQDRKVQATLPRPRKASHHFADSSTTQ